jgi:hypothetical protein
VYDVLHLPTVGRAGKLIHYQIVIIIAIVTIIIIITIIATHIIATVVLAIPFLVLLLV